MDFVYIDPGYGAGIDGTTYVENETYNPVNGVAFTSNSVVIAPHILHMTVANGTHIEKKLSIRFSVYLDLAPNDYFAVGLGSSTGLSQDKDLISFYSTGYGYRLAGSSTGVVKDTPVSSTAGFHNVAFSVRAHNNEDGGTLYHMMTRDIDNAWKSWTHHFDNNTYVSSVFDECVIFVFPDSSASTCYVSNVIYASSSTVLKSHFSASPLFTSEHLLVKLPLKDTSGDFTSLDNGEYVGNTAGQKLLSVVDAQDVITKFGGTKKVSHLVSYGHPGYRVGANITSATGISESDSSIAAHGSCALYSDSDASAAVAWAVDNTRLSDVDGMKIGWQV